MNTNYKSNNIAKWQRQIISAVCIGTFLFVTATFAQTPTLRANGKIAFSSDRDGNLEIYVMNADGDGKSDAAVYRDGIWYLRQSASGFSGVQFGLTNDKPVPSAYLP